MTAKPLILAYVIVGLGALALIGLVFDHDEFASLGILLGVVVGMAHGITFFVRVRKRRAVALLDARARTILAVTLAAVVGMGITNFATIAILLRDSRADQRGGLLSALVLIVFAYRAWLVPSARRAGILQISAVLFAVPNLVATTMVATDRATSIAFDARATTDTVLFITVIVVLAAGPVLDRLYATVADRDPAPVPEAIVLR